jgi:hypothetical protein
MDTFMVIRSGIFLAGGLISIIFRKQLNNFKNRMLKKLHLESKIKDEKKAYYYTGMIFIAISIILLIYAIMN